MARLEILEGDALEILLDDGRADVRGAGDGSRISESRAGGPRDRGDDALRLGGRLRGSALGEGDGSRERAAPRAEVLCRELVAEVSLDVPVEDVGGEVAQLAFDGVAEEPRAGQREEVAHGRPELRVGDRGVDERVPLAGEAKDDPASLDAYVPLSNGGDPVRPRAARVTVGADAEPAEVHEPDGDRADSLALERVELEVLGDRAPQRGQPLAEEDEPAELRLLLRGAEGGVVQVLPPARGVVPGRLQLRARPRGDPDVAPRRRNPQRVDPRERRRIVDPVPLPIEVPEPAPGAESPPSARTRHALSGCRGRAAVIPRLQ